MTDTPPPPGETQAQKMAHVRRLERRARFDLDVRGLLALLSIVLTFALAFVLILEHKSADVPAWAAAVVTGICGFYFGSKGGPNGG